MHVFGDKIHSRSQRSADGRDKGNHAPRLHGKLFVHFFFKLNRLGNIFSLPNILRMLMSGINSMPDLPGYLCSINDVRVISTNS